MGNLTALVGENNTGKSNILMALDRVLGRTWVTARDFSETDFFRYETDRQIEITIAFSPPIPYQRYKAVDPVEVAAVRFIVAPYKIGRKRGELRFEGQCLDRQGRPLTVPKHAPKKGQKLQFEPLIGIPTEVREAIPPVIYVDTHRSLQSQLPSARYSLLRRLLDDIDYDFNLPDNQIQLGDRQIPRSEALHDLMVTVFQLLRTDKFNAMEEAIRTSTLKHLGLGPKDDVDLSFTFPTSASLYRQLRLEVSFGGLTFDATEVSQSLQNAIFIGILEAYAREKSSGAVLLIEEPEMYLHPHRQRYCYELLRQIAERNQVLYTTHSPGFVRVSSFDEVRLVTWDPKHGTKIRSSTLKPSRQLKERLEKELDPTRNELLFARRVILVEGDTERLALPVYARRLGYDLNQKGVSVIEVGGKRNLPTFLDLVESFGLPVAVLFDLDSSDFRGSDRQEEEEFNAALLSRARNGVWIFAADRKFEHEVRRANGDDHYQRLCQKYGGVSKVVRQKLIAEDDTSIIPELFRELLDTVCIE